MLVEQIYISINWLTLKKWKTSFKTCRLKAIKILDQLLSLTMNLQRVERNSLNIKKINIICALRILNFVKSNSTSLAKMCNNVQQKQKSWFRYVSRGYHVWICPWERSSLDLKLIDLPGVAGTMATSYYINILMKVKCSQCTK